MKREIHTYRYITSGGIKATDKVSDYKLISSIKAYGESDFIRIELPDGFKLTKYNCDGYSTTKDKRTIAELNPAVIVRFNGVTKTDKELIKRKIHKR